MCVLEGHGHVVMDRLGHEHLKSQERMSRVLKNRNLDKRTAAFFRITGLEMKLNQYRMGEQFIKAVEKEAGWEGQSRFLVWGAFRTREIEAPSEGHRVADRAPPSRVTPRSPPSNAVSPSRAVLIPHPRPCDARVSPDVRRFT